LLRRDVSGRVLTLGADDLEVDLLARRVVRDGIELELTKREYELLEALAAYEGQVLTRDAIQSRIWMNDDRFSNLVDVYIGTLRKKIDSGHTVKLIQTIRGVGYSLRASSTEDSA